MASRVLLAMCGFCGLGLLPGCGSMLNCGMTPCGNNPDAHRVYGGVRTDIAFAAKGIVAPVEAIKEGKADEAAWSLCLMPFGVALAAVDLPICAVIDTVTLPYDIIHQVYPESVRRYATKRDQPLESAAPIVAEQTPDGS